MTQRSGVGYILSSIFVATFTKENAIVLPLLVLVLWQMKPDRAKGGKWPIIVMISGMIMMVGFRMVSLGQSTGRTLSWIAEASIWERLATLPYMIITYARLCWFPTHLHMEYHYVADTIFNLYTGCLVALIGGIWLLHKKKPKEARMSKKKKHDYPKRVCRECVVSFFFI